MHLEQPRRVIAPERVTISHREGKDGATVYMASGFCMVGTGSTPLEARQDLFDQMRQGNA
ncbi:hypothetical protein [Brucella intermedia]|uniref:hypothetical protein n=1 Tax=Brucella intermedia TaxID=94625 RepID=UPI00224B2B03|nr:hypothetical protein [Brucella intermedia]